jgi:glycosyltransferase involved in cell wall biosynthesis
MMMQKREFSHYDRYMEIGELGAGQEKLLAKYLVNRAGEFLFFEILHTRYYKPGVTFLRISLYKSGVFQKEINYGKSFGFLLRVKLTRRFILYILCLLIIFVWALKLQEKFDICVAINSPFPAVSLVLRKLSIVRKTIFLSSDHFSPSSEFSLDSIFLRLYRGIDRLAQNSSDMVWYTCSRLIKVKEKEGLITNKRIPRLLTPIGVDTDMQIDESLNIRERTSIVYVGHVDKDIGLGVVIEAVAEVAKEVPNIKLKIIGSGPTERELVAIVNKLGIKDNIEFFGFIGDREKIMSLMSKCAVSIAPYVPDLAFSIQYTDSGKVKEYIQSGLPVIITRTPEISIEIESARAGITVDYDKVEIAKAIRILMTNDILWHECQENVRKLAIKYDYRKIYNDAINTAKCSGIFGV